MDRLRGKIAFITGAGAGIGRAAARLFAREGAMVVIADIAREQGAEIEALVRADGGAAVHVGCDVTDEPSVCEAVAAAVRRFDALQILFNCAGGSVPEDSLVTDVDMGVWDRTINLDLKGTIHCCRHAIPQMVAAGGVLSPATNIRRERERAQRHALQLANSGVWWLP